MDFPLSQRISPWIFNGFGNGLANEFPPFPKPSKHLRARAGAAGPGGTQRAQMLRPLGERTNPLPNPLNIQGEIRWLRGKSIEYEREPLRLRDLIKRTVIF